MSVEPIVVGTDGSSTADRAVDKAGEIAAALGVTVHVVMCYNALSGAAGMGAAAWMAVDFFPMNEQAQAQAQCVVARAGERLKRMGVRVCCHLCVGEPADTLIKIAGDVGAQIIVVGNKGMIGPRRVLGSVPNRVSHHADRCVLIVHTC